MAFSFYRGLAIPLFAVAFCVIGLSTAPLAIPWVLAVLGVAVAAFVMATMGRWRGPSHRADAGPRRRGGSGSDGR
jgi:CBS-domain-containing membrane protein